MLQPNGYKGWDQLRLLDSGFAQLCRADPTVLDLHPQGATPTYAAPEVLRSLQQQYEGADANPDQAASFFLHLFHPVPYKRIAAVDHARTASTDLQQQQQAISSCGQGLLSQTKGVEKTQELQQQRQAISSCGQKPIESHKEGQVEKEDLLTEVSGSSRREAAR
ncbi:hypothetical protein WJX77_002166 [Trebouxia sp. C0004]